MITRRAVSGLAALVLGSGAVALPALAAADDAGAPARADRSGHRAGTYVVGDSITRYGTEELQAIRPGWLIDGSPGREVRALPMLVGQYVLLHGAPSRLVVALGTNPSEGWGRRDYQQVIDSLPASTEVFLVTPYRDAHRYARTSPVLGRYARAMRRIAADDERVTVVPWRETVRRGGIPLRDGVHPTVRGQELWARLVDHTVRTAARAG